MSKLKDKVQAKKEKTEVKEKDKSNKKAKDITLDDLAKDIHAMMTALREDINGMKEELEGLREDLDYVKNMVDSGDEDDTLVNTVVETYNKVQSIIDELEISE